MDPTFWEQPLTRALGGREQRRRQGHSEGRSVGQVQSRFQVAWVNAPDGQGMCSRGSSSLSPPLLLSA